MADLVLVISSTMETAAMLDNASPRNPREPMDSKSSAVFILLEACLKNAVGITTYGIQAPLSVIRIREIPPSFISMVIAVAIASMAFSVSSFTTEAGLSMTSPAAI